ncbi:MAG: tRNA preQ1(34) S-adenosylmethionine ribosyltransferase-isomerase QueA, partial [Planctomycetota bacterium]|nr:tRNA preQ1(34) S-adenosylmethionine ribosyltransferase-isomerase QueA [Planctomycetota bacterium]
MKTEQLNYYLPVELIAQQPCAVRSGSRLLVLGRLENKLLDSLFNRIGDFLQPGDCLVLNDTKVLPARFLGARKTGGKLEGLFLNEKTPGLWEVMLKGAGKVKTTETICLSGRGKDYVEAVVLEKTGQGRCLLKLQTEENAEAILERIGLPPLPPYIKRNANIEQAALDKNRYQTVYARKAGAVAAPTAGLHFTEELIERLKNSRIHFAYVTLHVGLGTFKPVNVENLEDHDIHEERFSIDEKNAGLINKAKKQGGRIIAVGTTSVRTLETIATDSQISAGSGATRIFITPGYKFKIINAMVTNFHLPKSTLLALVGAFAGLENILAAYQHA